MKKLIFILGTLALLVLLNCGFVLADKSAVSIEVPVSAEKDSEVVMGLKVTHSGNSYFHYTKWLKVQVDGKQVAQREYTNSSRPEDAVFMKEMKIKGSVTTEVIAEASCNIHGSAGSQRASIIVLGKGVNP